MLPTRNRARWFSVLTLRCRGARVHPIATLLAWRRRGTDVRVGQPNLLLHHVPAEPDHPVAAHDRVHGIRLPRERVRVGARHPSPREVIPAPLAIGMTVDHPHGA